MRLRHQCLIKILRFLYKLPSIHHLGFNSVLEVIERLCMFAFFLCGGFRLQLVKEQHHHQTHFSLS